MTELIKELEAVMAGLDECTDEVVESHYKALRFIRNRHAEIAEAVKDAGRYRWLRREDCPVDFTEMRWECDEGLDNYIDAAMHNSAREEGES